MVGKKGDMHCLAWSGFSFEEFNGIIYGMKSVQHKKVNICGILEKFCWDYVHTKLANSAKTHACDKVFSGFVSQRSPYKDS